MEDLPDLALQRILEFSDITSRKVCRSVCARWKLEIENNIGLAVVIDDRHKDLTDFMRNVTMKEANIKYLRCKDPAWFTLPFDDVRTLIFSGYVNPNFIKTNLMNGAEQWKNLTKLYFYGSSLISQPFSEPGNGNNAQTNTPFVLPNLKEFHLIAAFGTIKQAVIQFDYGISTKEFSFLPMIRHPGIYINTMLETRATRNATYLMRSISSKNLKVLMYSIGTHTSQLLSTVTELFKFVEDHGKTLEKLICPTLIMNNSFHYNQAPEKRVIRLPAKLKSVYISRIIPVLPTNRIWIDLVENQTHLVDVFLEVEEFPFHTFDTFLTNIFSKNVRTLKYFTIRCDWIDMGIGGIEVDLECLTTSTCLEVLRIIHVRMERKPVFYPIPESRYCPCGCDKVQFYTVSEDPSLTFELKNINSLPTCLKVFETTFATTEDFDGTRFMKEMVNLEELKLSSIRRVGMLESRLHVVEFIQAALRHRTLHVFDIEFGFFIGTVPDIGRTWNEISRCEDLDPVNPYAAHFLIVDSESDPETDTNTWWTIESICIGGMNPENTEGNDAGLVLEDDENKSYMRHYFDVIDKGGYPGSTETVQPFNIDHSSAKSYILNGIPVENCWGGNFRYQLCSITTSSMSYSSIYNKCGAGQGMNRVALLVNKEQRAMLDAKFGSTATTDDTGILEPDIEEVIASLMLSKTSPEVQTEVLSSSGDSSSDSETSESDLDNEEFARVNSVRDSSATGNAENITTPIRFNYNASFVLSQHSKPVIIGKKYV